MFFKKKIVVTGGNGRFGSCLKKNSGNHNMLFQSKKDLKYKKKALDAGCDEYDTKPIEFDNLLEKINRAGTTVVMATHDSSIVNRRKKRVIQLKEGKLLSDVDGGRYL